MTKFPSRWSPLSLACAAVFQAGPALAVAPGYTLQWLGFLSAGDTISYARDINASGQVVGSSGTNNGSGYNNQTRGFLWSQGTGLTDLGRFAVCATQPCYTADANGTWNNDVTPWAVNDTGQAAGIANGPGGYEYAFSHTPATGMIAPLGTVVGRNNGALGINNSGEIVGHTMGTFNGTFWSEVGYVAKADGSVRNLPGLTGSDVMYAYDINDAGVVVGGASYRLPPDGINPPGTITFGYRPVIWEKGATGYTARVLPGFETATNWNFAHAVNASGQVAGYLQVPNAYHAFLWDNGTTTDLGCGMAQGINAAGTVVGGDVTIGGSAFIYIQGARYDLNALAVNKAAADQITYASGINDAGWIAGSGTHNGQTEALVLIPTGSVSAAAPSDPCPGSTVTPPPPPPPPTADLVLTMSAAPDPVAVGAKLTYTISVTNNGPDTATAATVGDTLPANVTFTSVSTTLGTCAGTTTVGCSLGDLAPGATATIKLAVKPKAAGVVTNTAAAASTVDEANPADNSATARTKVTATATTGGADLSVTLLDEPDPAVLGEPVVYVAQVYNKSAANASAVVLTANLPTGVPVTKTEGATCTGTGAKRTCALGTISANSAKEVKFTLQPVAVGTLTGSVTVASTTADPNAANNKATATTTVR